MLKHLMSQIAKYTIGVFFFSSQLFAEEINIQSDAANFDDKTGTVTYMGHVVVREDNHLLQADTLTIHRERTGEMNLLIAKGSPVRFKMQRDLKKSPMTGNAEVIHYYPKEGKIILMHNATIIQDDNSISGPKITYFLKSGSLHSESEADQKSTLIFQPRKKP